MIIRSRILHSSRRFFSSNVVLSQELTNLLGKGFSQAQIVREQHASTETYHEGHVPIGVVFPKTVEEISETVKLCEKHNAAIVGFGAGTSLEGHLIATKENTICVSFRDMNNILEINEENMDCLVEPGVTREQLNYELRHKGMWFTIDPGANASIGGMAATNASGTTTLRYGSMKQNVMEVEFVGFNGKVFSSGCRARKNSAGYDFKNLMIGSEGTLGLLSKIRLRLYPIPQAIAAIGCTFDKIEDAINLVSTASVCGIRLARMELVDPLTIEAMNYYSNTTFPVKWTIFLEIDGSESGVKEDVETLQELAEEYSVSNFKTAVNQEDRNKIWKTRHSAYYAQKARAPQGTSALVSDVAVPIDRLAECFLQAREQCDELGLYAPGVGHVGDGNFHFSIFHDLNNKEEVEKVNTFSQKLIDLALSMGGTVTGEHGIGRGKMKYLKQMYSEDSIELMKIIKRSMDPHNVFNPGKIVEL